LESELQRIARRLVECLDELPKVAGDLREQANWCREKAALVGQLARGDPKGSQIAALLDGAARRCEEAAETCLKAHQPGRDWAMDKVGDAGASAGAASAKTAGLRAEHPDPTPAEVREPSGEELTKERSERLSRAERMRREVHSIADDAIDVVEQAGQLTQGILAPQPPTYAHAEIRSPPVTIERPREGVDAGSAASATLVLAILISEVVRWLHHGWTRRHEGRG
jgi:hypothetical protein